MKREISEKELFETTPVPRAVASLAIPAIISQVVTMIYNLAFFVGQMHGTASFQRIQRMISCIRSATPGSVLSMIPGSSHPSASSFSPCPPVMVHRAVMTGCSLWL